MSLRRCNCEQFEALSTDYGNLLRQSNAFEIERDTASEQLREARKLLERYLSECACGGSGRIVEYDTATYIGQTCSPIGDSPCESETCTELRLFLASLPKE